MRIAAALCVALAACAPPGYHYDVGSFVPTPNYDPQPAWSGISSPIERAAQPPSESEIAQREFCGRHPGVSCAMYAGEVARCEYYSAQGISVMRSVRLWISKGLTPRQAIDITTRSMGGYDSMAEVATEEPDTMTPEEFRARVLKSCLAAIE